MQLLLDNGVVKTYLHVSPRYTYINVFMRYMIGITTEYALNCITIQHATFHYNQTRRKKRFATKLSHECAGADLGRGRPFRLRQSTPSPTKAPPLVLFYDIQSRKTDSKVFLKATWVPIYNNFQEERASNQFFGQNKTFQKVSKTPL